MSEWLKKAMEAAASIDGRPAAVDAQAQQHFPALVDLMTVTLGVDEKPRRTGMLMVMAEGGQWKVGYVGRDINRSLWCEGATVLGAIEELERALEIGTDRWQAKRRR